MTAPYILHWADVLAFSAMLLMSLGIGAFSAIIGKRQKTTADFLMGGHRLGLMPVALSMFMSYVSGIFVLGSSAEMYLYGTQSVLMGLSYTLAYLLAAFIFVPALYPLQLVSSYQYFEMRFASRVLRRLLSILQVIHLIFYTGMALYAPAIALEGVTGWSAWITMLISGLVATIYTSLGGMRAVVWTDAFQAGVFYIGMLVILVVGCMKCGGIANAVNIANDGGRIIFFNTDTHYRARVTLWNVLIGGTVNAFSFTIMGQGTIQRYTALKTLRAAKWSMLLNAPMMIFSQVMMCLTGLVIYSYYKQLECDPLKSGTLTSSNQLFPYFVVDVLSRPGLPGLVIATLFSGALSSVSSNMSSVSALIWKDFLEWSFAGWKEYQKAVITKVIVVLFGVVSIAFAMLVGVLPGHILQISNAVLGPMSAVNAGALLLGLLVPYATWKGAVAGVVAGMSLISWISIGQFMTNPFRSTLPTSITNCTLASNVTIATPEADQEYVFPLYGISFHWFSLIALAATFIAGVLFSIITGAENPKNLDPRLVIPIFDRLCCCMPLSLRRMMWCGIPRDSSRIQSSKASNNSKIDYQENPLEKGQEMDSMEHSNLLKETGFISEVNTNKDMMENADLIDTKQKEKHKKDRGCLQT